MSVNMTRDFLASLQKNTVKSTVQHHQKKRQNANAAEISALMETMMGATPRATAAPKFMNPTQPAVTTKPTASKKTAAPAQLATTPPSVVETQSVEPQELDTPPVTAVEDVRQEEPIRKDEVLLQTQESAAASFLPRTQAHSGKSTQKKQKDAKSHSSQDIDPGLALLIQSAIAARAAAAEQKDVVERIQSEPDSEFEAVFQRENQNSDDQTFISTATFRATKQKQGRLNVAAYIRVSSDSTDQEYSYETQERYFNQMIESNPDWNAVGIYSDYGISGTGSDKRTGFKRLLRHCREGKIDRVVCKSISRFARNTTDFMIALRILRESNTTILFEKENLDTADPTSEFILTTLGAIAQEESRSISGNINLGNKMRFKRGDVRNEIIYGYRYNGEMVTSASGYQYKDVEIVEEEAEIVRRIFREVADGTPYVEIARKLNQEHVPAPDSPIARKRRQCSKKGQLNSHLDDGWTSGRISAIVRNERYVGDVLAQKTYTTDYLTHQVRQNKGEVQQYHIQDHHAAIVDRELFDEAQKAVRNNSAAHNTVGKKTVHAFSGRLVCGECGRYFSIRNAKNNPIWFCPSTARRNGKTICHTEKVYEEQIIRVVRRAVIERFELTVQPIQDDVKVADILSGRFAETEGVFSSKADSFVVQMQARLENIQRLDYTERDRTFYKRQITALYTSADTARKKVRLLQSQKDALETRRFLLGDMTVEEASITEKEKQIADLRTRIERDEAEGKKLSEQIDYLESYWAELEDDFDRREDAIEWMKTLPQGRTGTVAFLNGLTGDYCKSFILSITVYSPLRFTVHWFDDTRTEVEMYSNIEDYRCTASYFDGVAMRDSTYRNRYTKKQK